MIRKMVDRPGCHRYRGIYAIGNLLGLPPDPRIAARKLRRKRCRIAAVVTTCTALVVGSFLAFGMPLVRCFFFKFRRRFKYAFFAMVSDLKKGQG